MNNSSTGTCIYFFSEQAQVFSTLLRYASMYIIIISCPLQYLILDPRSSISWVFLSINCLSGLVQTRPFSLSRPFSLLGLFLSISFFSISSPSIGPSVITPYVRLRSVGLDSTYVCKCYWIMYLLPSFRSCFLLASFFLLPIFLSLSFCLLFCSARRLELIRLLGRLALWVCRPIGSIGLLFGWVGLGLRITPATCSYLSFFFSLGCCITWVKFQLMWSRVRLSLVVVFEVVSAVVCVASMH